MRKFGRWELSTYRHVWFAAPLGFGIPAFAISVAFGRPFVAALIYAVSITVVGGAGQSYRLSCRLRRAAEARGVCPVRAVELNRRMVQ